MLHRVYDQDRAKYHQLMLPIELEPRQWNCSIIRFYWSTLLQDITNLVKNCKWCQTANGPHVDPDPSQGSIVANNPMDLLCIDFMKVDPSKDGKENVLVMTDAFSKFSVAVVMPNQRVKTVVKALVDKCFTLTGHKEEYTVTRVKVLITNS